MLRDAIIRLAYSRPDLRPHLLRVLTADVPAGEGGREEEEKSETKKKGPPPMWKEFLDAKYEGGKKKVQNANPETKDRYDQVSMTTRFKKDKSYQQGVYKEYREWMKKQKGDKKPDSSKSEEPEEPKTEEGKPKEPELTVKEYGDWLAMTYGKKHKVLGEVGRALYEGKVVDSEALGKAIKSVDKLLETATAETEDDLRSAKKALEAQREKAPKPEPKPKKPKVEKKPEEKPKEKPKEKPAWLPASTKAWDEYGKQYNESRETWTESERYGVSQYTGSAYTALNKQLRKSEELNSYAKKVADGLDSIFKDPKKGRVLQDVMVARGAGQSHPLTKMLQNGTLEVGMEFEDKGFVSTSIKPWGEHSWGSGVQMNIHVPKGAKGIYVGPPPYGYSSVASEYELLLDRNVKMRVTGFNASTKKVDLEVVV